MFSPSSYYSSSAILHDEPFFLMHICEYISNIWFHSTLQLNQTNAFSSKNVVFDKNPKEGVKRSKVREASWLIHGTYSFNPWIWQFFIQ